MAGYNISLGQLEQMAPFSTDKLRIAVIQPLNEAMNEFQINTPLRVAAFLAQIIHESGSFRYVKEIASGEAYDTGKKAIALGNTPEKDGDGQKYKGRGYIQITGLTNYKECGKALNLDLINQPELLEQVVNACRSAAWFWNVKNLNSYADVGLFGKITHIINGGYNGAEERLANYARCKKVLGVK